MNTHLTAEEVRVLRMAFRLAAFKEAAEVAAIECCDECCRIVPKNIRALAEDHPPCTH